jgi:hypothetical protein
MQSACLKSANSGHPPYRHNGADPQLYEFGSQGSEFHSAISLQDGALENLPSRAGSSDKRAQEFALRPHCNDGSNVARVYAPLAARGGGVKYGWWRGSWFESLGADGVAAASPESRKA